MAHILLFPNVSHDGRWPARVDRPPPVRDSAGGLAALLATLENVLEAIRLAWWDGSSLALSRGGLETLVGLEPGDATPPRLVPVEARARMRTEVRA